MTYQITPNILKSINCMKVILLLTLYRGYKHSRYSATPLLFILYRDGALFFALLVGESKNHTRSRSVLIHEQRSLWEMSLLWV